MLYNEEASLPWEKKRASNTNGRGRLYYSSESAQGVRGMTMLVRAVKFITVQERLAECQITDKLKRRAKS